MPARVFLDHLTPFAVAHRGGAEDLPENTLPAFDAAVALGYAHIETDAHLSSDGVVFAFHDLVLDRVTDKRGRLADVSAGTIASADAAYHFNPRAGFPLRGCGIGVPTMEQVLTRWPGVFVNIDPKSDDVVQPLIHLLRRLEALDRVCVGSFSDQRIQRVRLLSGGAVCTSMGPRAITTAWLASRSGRMPRLGADCVQVPRRHRGLRVVDRLFVGAAHRAGLQVHVWTIDTAAEMISLLDVGVDAIMTDRPHLLREVLSARGQWHGGAGGAA
ncbi:MAG: glycerophosphodiester phosphodiesterase [Candidatus Dormibacteraeota bacterium]|uniref:Glycerophosphodiester phosphodiesterase n=1 Tax=Candidatus Amunia macphersoniae TaxID=3127014 RepID=A0A934KE69_9BACT|nr:glycerophosphodiester phosphodiesterase [Candidatus Dormibacteraeota bacterium]